MKEKSEKKVGHEEANLLRFLSFRPRSIKEVRDYGKRKKIPESLVETFIKKMKKLEYLDDEKFTRLWVRDRQKLLGLGKSRIKRELLQKGISPYLIEQVLEAEYSTDDEAAAIRKFIRKKKNSSRQQILAGLIRRGFAYQTVQKILSYLSRDLSPQAGFEGVDEI